MINKTLLTYTTTKRMSPTQYGGYDPLLVNRVGSGLNPEKDLVVSSSGKKSVFRLKWISVSKGKAAHIFLLYAGIIVCNKKKSVFFCGCVICFCSSISRLSYISQWDSSLVNVWKSLVIKYHNLSKFLKLQLSQNEIRVCGSSAVKVSDHGRYVMSSSPVPQKTHRVGKRFCILLTFTFFPFAVLRKHGKLIAFFRSFLLSRPSRRKLKQSGILKERVFGCDLGEHLMNTSRDIPLVLKCCTEFIEQHGIVDGIYRLSGVTSNIQKLRLAFDEDRVPNLMDEAILQDIHCVASLLKMYFRELPNPLLTFHLYDKFVNAVQADEDMRLLKLRDVVQQLPPPHYRSLEYLMRHLSKVAAHGFQTGMTPKNVAIVWAPNLLRSRDIENGGVGALHVVGVQAVLTEYLIRYTDIIFSEKMPVFPSPKINEGFKA
ncbi:UNVERIFIED_CONTAM: CdGAPr [Trichonephila clavipes]